jgi:hypothetical protein
MEQIAALAEIARKICGLYYFISISKCCSRYPNYEFLYCLTNLPQFLSLFVSAPENVRDHKSSKEECDEHICTADITAQNHISS